MELLHTAHVPAGEGPFPTVLALHGWGASAHDLIGLAPLLHRGKALVLCPQGPVRVPIGPGAEGYGWFPLAAGRPPDPAEFRKGVAVARDFLDAALERYPADPRKLVVLGFSQGGVLGYDLALRDPARFAALVALSSWLPSDLAASIPRSAEHGQLPTLVMHGTEDPMIPVDRARDSRGALTELGVDLSYREHAMAHEIAPSALRELLRWLDEKVFQPVMLA